MNDNIKTMVFDLKNLEIKAKNGNKLACYNERGKELGDLRCAYRVGACYYFGFGNVERDKK